jgi:hypothetical protein
LNISEDGHEIKEFKDENSEWNFVEMEAIGVMSVLATPSCYCIVDLNDGNFYSPISEHKLGYE